MTYGGPSEGALSKNERREAAREKSKVLRDQQRKKERRSSALLKGSLLIGALAIIAIVALVIINTARPPGPGPRNMLSDGIRIGEEMKVVSTPALPADEQPIPHKREAGSSVVDIQVYVDYFCPGCHSFDATNRDLLEGWLNTGAATLEIHPISILNPNSQGTKYSTRSANAAACVANYSPDSYWGVNEALLANQPKERTPGLTDEELIDVVTRAGVSSASDISDCIRDQTFKEWVENATYRALEGPVPNSDVVVKRPLTVLVNGLAYEGAVDDADAFAAFVVQAAGATFNDTATPTPTPTPDS